MPRIGHATQTGSHPDARPLAARPRTADAHLALLDEDRAWVEQIRQGDEAAFQKIAAGAKKDCPLSKALAAVPEISLASVSPIGPTLIFTVAL